MTGKELLIKALKGGQTPRPAWVPFVGVHGGNLIEVDSTQYLQSVDLMLKGLKRSIELYKPDGLPVCFDLQMEAEVLGCNLAWAAEVPPSVITHPLMGDGAIADLPTYDLSKGRFPLVAEVTKKLKEDHGDEIALYGLITGPFTLASHLRGSELFMDLLMNPDYTRELMAYANSVAKATASFYLELGCDVIAVVDPMTSQISAEHFEDFITPYLNELFTHIRVEGGLSSLFVCGDATRNLEVMCKTVCNNISVDENIPLELLCNLARKHGKSAGGNLKLTTVLLLGKEADAMLDAIRCIDIGGNQGFVLAPGCDLPYGTPEKNLQAVANMVSDEYQRQVARTSVTLTDLGPFDDIELPNFAKEKAVILDCITLDSAACAPCLYTVDAAIKASAQTAIPTEVREHKIKSREGIGYMTRMGIDKIPAICVDGDPVFISQIPDTETLIKVIEEKAKQYGKA